MEEYMARKKSTAVLEGEEITPTSDEEIVVAETIEEETAPQDDEATTEEVISTPEEEIGLSELTNIKLLMKGPIRGHDGNKINKGQTGKVASSIADALVGRGQAEYE
jgi:hypothetical protein